MTLSIMIVDDDEIFQEAIARMFKRFDQDNFKVNFKSFVNPVEAFDHLNSCAERNRLPDLCLVDINMPEMSGHELLEKIRSNNNLKKLVIFMLTSSQMQSDIKKAYENIIAGYLVKSSFDVKYNDLGEFLHNYSDKVKFIHSQEKAS